MEDTMSLITDAGNIPAGHPEIIAIGKEIEAEMADFLYEPITGDLLHRVNAKVHNHLESCVASRRIYKFYTSIHHSPSRAAIDVAIRLTPGEHIDILTLHLQ
jgi:hypothetical protein